SSSPKYTPFLDLNVMYMFSIIGTRARLCIIFYYIIFTFALTRVGCIVIVLPNGIVNMIAKKNRDIYHTIATKSDLDLAHDLDTL
ncbi:hypothetical protein ACJX0J_028706, partial [Zea mays]